MAIGEFGAVLDTQTFTAYESIPPSLRKRTKNIVLLYTQNPANNHPYLRSISISDAGLINPTPIDDLTLEAWPARDYALLHWLEDVFVTYHNFTNGVDKIYTVSCDEAGAISGSYLDLLQLQGSANTGFRPDLIKPHDGVLLTGASLPVSPYHVNSVSITDTGQIAAAVADSMPYPIAPKKQSLRQGAGDRIIALTGSDDWFNINSFTCSHVGVLPAAVTDTWADIPSTTCRNSLCKVTDSVYAVLLANSDGTTCIHTFSIKPDGTINKAWIDTEQVDAAASTVLHMMEMGGGYFLLAYTLALVPWTLKTYRIYPDGTIKDAAIDSMTRPTGNSANSFFEYLDNDIWTFTHGGAAGTVDIETIEIGMPSENQPHNELTLGIGP